MAIRAPSAIWVRRWWLAELPAKALRERNYNVANADIRYNDQITRLVERLAHQRRAQRQQPALLHQDPALLAQCRGLSLAAG